MRILHAVTYYTPHVSGLTLCVKHLAEEQIKRGHQVIILTSQHQKSLPLEEKIGGVIVKRVPVLLSFSKAVVMPFFWPAAIPLIRQSTVTHLHLPSIEGADLALLSKIFAHRVVVTYYCDLVLPPMPLQPLFQLAIRSHNFMACLFADSIVTLTQDFANHSSLLKLFGRKVQAAYPPIFQPPRPAPLESPIRELTFPVLGMACRFAQDKGIEYLLNALPSIIKVFPQLKVLFAGETQKVIGESAYRQKLQPLLEKHSGHLIFLGQLTPAQMPKFYQLLDLLVVSSINSTEAFGLVQVEAMLQGVPVVATDLPGVRVPVQVTGMGEIARVADADDLAEKVIQVLQNKKRYLRPKSKIEQIFDLEKSIQFYDKQYC